MKTSLTLASALVLFPAIAIGVFVSALTPTWLLGPSLAFAFFLLFVGTIVRFLGIMAGLLLRVLVWVVSIGMFFVGVYALAVEPHHPLLAWMVLLTAILALLSTPPPRRTLA